MTQETLTPEQIEKHFSAAMDSVSLIKALSSKAALTEGEKDIVARNKEHLQTVIDKGWFTAKQIATLKSVL